MGKTAFPDPHVCARCESAVSEGFSVWGGIARIEGVIRDDDSQDGKWLTDVKQWRQKNAAVSRGAAPLCTPTRNTAGGYGVFSSDSAWRPIRT